MTDAVILTLQKLIEQMPWLESAAEMAAMAWAFAKSGSDLLLLLGLFFVAHRIKSERSKIESVIQDLGLKIGTLEQQAKAAIDAAEALPSEVRAASTSVGSTPAKAAGTNPNAEPDPARWEELRAGWRKIRDRLELAIGTIRHRSRRAKYARIPRHNYRDLIIALANDGVISKSAEAELLSLNQLFMSFRPRPLAVGLSDLAMFRLRMLAVDNELPKTNSAGDSALAA